MRRTTKTLNEQTFGCGWPADPPTSFLTSFGDPGGDKIPPSAMNGGGSRAVGPWTPPFKGREAPPPLRIVDTPPARSPTLYPRILDPHPLLAPLPHILDPLTLPAPLRRPSYPPPPPLPRPSVWWTQNTGGGGGEAGEGEGGGGGAG